MSNKHKSGLTRTLRQRGLELTFAGTPFCDYTCSQLRDLLNLFDATVLDEQRWLKVDYCDLLLEVKPTLTQAEFEAAQLIAAGSDLQEARDALTNFQPNHTPGAQSVENEGPENQTNSTFDQLNSAISRPSRTCDGCLEVVPLTSYPRVASDGNCNHTSLSLCADCFGHYITSQSETFALDAIPCPEAACPGFLSYQVMQENASGTLFERYQNTINSRAITSASDYLECSNTACPAGGIVEESTMTYMVCNACSTSTCLSCKTAWHPGISHKKNQAAIAKLVKQDQRTNKYLLKHTKPCPQCGVAISKNNGCDHMTW